MESFSSETQRQLPLLNLCVSSTSFQYAKWRLTIDCAADARFFLFFSRFGSRKTKNGKRRTENEQWKASLTILWSLVQFSFDITTRKTKNRNEERKANLTILWSLAQSPLKLILQLHVFFADFAERDVTPKKRFSVVVSCSTSFHRKNRPAEKSFSVVVQQQAERRVVVRWKSGLTRS